VTAAQRVAGDVVRLIGMSTVGSNPPASDVEPAADRDIFGRRPFMPTQKPSQ
jgi:hypothetical protein